MLTIPVPNALFPHLNNHLPPFIIKPLQRVAGRLSSLRFHVLPSRSVSGFCHRHSTENMPLKISSLPHWPAGRVSPSPIPTHGSTLSPSPFPSQLGMAHCTGLPPPPSTLTHTEIPLRLCLPCGHFPEFFLFSVSRPQTPSKFTAYISLYLWEKILESTAFQTTHLYTWRVPNRHSGALWPHLLTCQPSPLHPVKEATGFCSQSLSNAVIL